MMYYIVYGLLYTFSLLPLRVLYLFSDFAWFIIYRLMKYRMDIVMNNLSIAFPEKTIAERKKIAKQFYLNFTDTFIESIKMISISKKEVLSRGHCDFELINELVDKGNNLHIVVGHQFNWEFANLVYGMHVKIPFVGIYMPVNNKIIDRIFFKVRERYGTILISAKEFKNKMHSVFSEQYILALAADQNPGIPSSAFWLNFFGKAAPFVKGPGKGAVKNNTAVCLWHLKSPVAANIHSRLHCLLPTALPILQNNLLLCIKISLKIQSEKTLLIIYGAIGDGDMNGRRDMIK